MATGKYSPTVNHSYHVSSKWHKSFDLTDGVYDPQGFDSYGYNADGKDRAGYTENDYLWDSTLFDDVLAAWRDRDIAKEIKEAFGLFL